jgi:hypothetical protein
VLRFAKTLFVGAKAGAARARKSRTAQLTVEGLEERSLMAVGVGFGAASAGILIGNYAVAADISAMVDQPTITVSTPGDYASLNPQPLPPNADQLSTPLDLVSLNPQPLPPKVIGDQVSTPADLVSLNPQPLPPKVVGDQASTLGDLVSLNPQPLPPKVIDAVMSNPAEQAGIIIVGGHQSDPYLGAAEQAGIIIVGGYQGSLSS